MKIQNPFITGLAATMFVMGMVLPASAELVPQPYTSIVDWEDEYAGRPAAQPSQSLSATQGSFPSLNTCSSQAVVLDWEDEFVCVHYGVASPSDAPTKLQSKNAASWSFEDWQSM